MTTSFASNQDIFDVRKIRRLVELMKEHDLSEINLQQGEVRIQLCRASAAARTTVAALPVTPSLPAGQPSLPAPPLAAVTAVETKADSTAIIKSPMVGTFYAATDPESPPFVKVGDHIGPETTVCIVEAMKVFNQIPAEVSGRVTAVLAENGSPVEFGQPLFKVDTRE
jgi:acetyl-CoA carboxylase biotin carboxyl carrier protein